MEADREQARKPGIVSERVLAQGRHVAFTELEVSSRNGGTHTNQIVRHPGSVTILPVLESGGQEPCIVFVENYRAALDARLLELPAGKLEPGEDPAEAAGRELIEETGYRSGRIQPLVQFYTTPGLTDERMHVFIARDLVYVGQQLEDDEDLIVQKIPLQSALQLAADGRIEDAKSALAMLTAYRRGQLGAMS